MTYPIKVLAIQSGSNYGMSSVQFNDHMFIIHTLINLSLTESVTFKRSCIKIALFEETKGRHYARLHTIPKMNDNININNSRVNECCWLTDC